MTSDLVESKKNVSNSELENNNNDLKQPNHEHLRRSSLFYSNESSQNEFDTKSNTNTIISVPIQSKFSYLNPFNWISTNTDTAIEEIEKNIFKNIKTSIDRYYVKIRNKSLKIWTLSANTSDKTNTPIVCIHGFCGGIGLWVQNIDALSETRPFYAFDLLGFGRSSRPLFSNDPIVAETQFIESIEDWRKEVGLNEIILMGHSFGGYLSAAYALKYPENIKALILVDPWGFPEYNGEFKPDTPMPLWISMIAKLSQYISPLSVFRLTGQFGVGLFKRLRPDFKNKYSNIIDDPDAVYSYLYHSNNYHPSGEAGFRAIAKFFGFAKNPMIKRIDKIKTHIPIWFVYGSRSWIDCTSGFTAVYTRQTYSDVAPISVEIISGAGHHVYADRPKEFNDYMRYIFEIIDENYQELTNQEFMNRQENLNNTLLKAN